MNSSIFYDFQKVLSYNALLNIIIGERGVGKTYGMKKFCINRFKKQHKQFAYIRRYESDLDSSVGSSQNNKFFEQVQKEFKNSKFNIKKSKKIRSLIIDDEVCGYALPLSSADSLKSSTYENVDIIIYDEFMLKPGTTQRYLKNEPEIILDLIETIGRLRDIRVFCLGNAISSTCPLMSYFDLTLPYNSEIKLFKDGLILVNYIKNEKYREVKKQTRFGKLIENTPYGEYAIDNKMMCDNKAFIRKKDKNSKFFFIFILNGKYYGVWNDYVNGMMFISKDYDPNCPVLYCLNNEDHNENSMYINPRRSLYFKSIIDNYKIARLCFESQAIKNEVMNELYKYLT